MYWQGYVIFIEVNESLLVKVTFPPSLSGTVVDHVVEEAELSVQNKLGSTLSVNVYVVPSYFILLYLITFNLHVKSITFPIAFTQWIVNNLPIELQAWVLSISTLIQPWPWSFPQSVTLINSSSLPSR